MWKGSAQQDYRGRLSGVLDYRLEIGLEFPQLDPSVRRTGRLVFRAEISLVPEEREWREYIVVKGCLGT